LARDVTNYFRSCWRCEGSGSTRWQDGSSNRSSGGGRAFLGACSNKDSDQTITDARRDEHQDERRDKRQVVKEMAVKYMVVKEEAGRME
jgi:hypothetical protein